MKYQVVIVSDLHLGTKDSKAEEFIEFIENHPTELLILNGDIIDGWALKSGGKWNSGHSYSWCFRLDGAYECFGN